MSKKHGEGEPQMEMIRKATKLRISKRFGAVGLAAALALTAMLIPKIGLSARAAQSEESESHAKGLQGTVRDCQTGVALRTFPALFTFAKGGTLSVTTAGQLPALSTTSLGVWRHTDGHAYSAVSEAFVFSTAGAWTQTHRLTRAIEIGNNEDEFTDTVALQIFDTNGNVIVTGCATSVGSRFE
jgi:hypothetical protein